MTDFKQIKLWLRTLTWVVIILLGTFSYEPTHNSVVEASTLQPTPMGSFQAITADFKEIEPLSVTQVQNTLPDEFNLYEPGNCTFGVASWIKVPMNLGNANTWAIIAAAQGFPVSPDPLPGAVAVSTAGFYGHVALVLDVSEGQVLVREENVYGLGVVTVGWYSIDHFSSYIYF